MPVPGFFAGSDTKARLTFVRPAGEMDDGEYVPDFEDGLSVVVEASVVANPGTQHHLKDLIDTYEGTYDVIINGCPDIRRRDQVRIPYSTVPPKDRLGEVLTIAKFAGHMELLVGVLPTIDDV